MSDKLTIVNRLIDEHQTIRTHIKLVGDSVNDLEGLLSLERARPDWMLNPPELISEKLNKMLQTAHLLQDGLKNHFSFEEKSLPPLLGEIVMRALILEHSDIRNALDGFLSTLLNTKIEGSTYEQLLTFKWNVNQRIEDLRQLLEGHATREETILKMMKRALEDKGKPTA